ncbi:hypothetical protein D3C87_880280 [compost metagenome]
MTAQSDLEAFDRQVQTLIAKGYPAIAGMTPEAFAERLEPLKLPLKRHVSEHPAGDGRVPFVLVIPQAWVTLEDAMPLTALKERNGFIDFKPGGLETFKPLPELGVPEEGPYLAFGLETGSEYRNVTPDDALSAIRARERTPLTLEEGIALLTQFPETLKKNHCYSLAGSRSQDRRVPALWISQLRPKLGWCWAGNPHTWLGTAFCSGRVGEEA